MAQGQKTFSSAGREIQKPLEFKPITPGEYEFKLNVKDLEVKVKEGPGNLPYINGPLEVLGTGGDSGKNRRIYHRLFLDMTPSKKDGIAMIDRGAGLVALARALGTELTDITVVTKQKRLDSGAMEDHDILNPKDVITFLSGFDGSVISGRVKVVPADGQYGPKNEIDSFVPADVTEEEEEEDEDTEVEEEVAAPRKLASRR